MNQKDFYHGQTVVETELDGALQYVEDWERLLAIDTGLSAREAADTPSPTIFGGLLSGGGVTKVGAKLVQVEATVGRDSSGRYVYCPVSTVSLTKLGATTIGDSTDALGAGANVAITNEAWVTLWLVYGEVLSDPRTDATGTTVYFDIEESFRFQLDQGTDAAAPATARAALVDNRLLLADILLDSTGEIRVIGLVDAICASTADFVALGAGYTAMTGRRYDWLTLENAADFPLYDGTGLRLGTARQVLYELVKQLQKQTATAGAGRIGARAASAAVAYPVQTAVNLTAGSVDSQIAALLTAVAGRLCRGGDTVRPIMGNGLNFDPTNLGYGNALIKIQAERDGAALSDFMSLGLKWGHIALPHLIYDDFCYASDAGFQAKWAVNLVGAGAINRSTAFAGGVMELNAGAAAGGAARMTLGGDPSTMAYEAGIFPYAIFGTRFRVPSLTDLRFYVGFAHSASASQIILQFDETVDPTALSLDLNMVGGGVSATGVVKTALLVNTWYTARVAIVSSSKALFWIKGDDAPAGAGDYGSVELAAPGAWDGGMWQLTGYAENLTGSGPSPQVYVDHMMAARGALPSDASVGV